MFRLAVPGVIGALLFSSVGLVEANFLRASGVNALAAVALVYPLVILAAMFSAGAIGGAVTGLTARAIGAGDTREASAVLVCAVLISLVGGVLMWAVVVQFGHVLFNHASSNPVVTEAAQLYAELVFPAIPAFWLINMLCSVLRGSGDMVRPAVVAAGLLASYISLAFFIIPSQGAALDESIRAAATAMIGSFLFALFLSIFFIAQSRQTIRFRVSAYHTQTLVRILKQGLLASSQSVMTIIYALTTTLLFGRFGTEWLAGFGLAVRLELIMVPVIFGIGSSIIPIVGAYVGAGQRQRAISIAWRGVIINTILVGFFGLFLALFPGTWCGIVGSDLTVIENCSQSLRVIAPTYAFFALGLGCYFGSQGLNTLKFPVLGSLLRLLIVATGLYWVTETTSINVVLYLVAGAVVTYGLFVGVGLRLGPWRSQPSH
ncbi:MAG: MATE family efflux transporter [Granulosicoccus sp.]